MEEAKMVHLKTSVIVIMILCFTKPLVCSAQSLNQEVLARSKIKNKSFKKVFRDIKKGLPKQSKKCSIVVTDIKLLKRENDSVAEEWTVDICQEANLYFVSTFHPKGYYCTVTPKKEVLAKEKSFWNAAKKHGDEAYWREVLFYEDEIEAMYQRNNYMIENEDSK